MIKEAIEKILDLGKIEQVVIDWRNYTSKVLVPVKKPTPNVLTVHTLSGLVDYLTGEIDGPKETQKNHFIHVVDPCHVDISATFKGDSFFERPYFVAAVFDPPAIQSGQHASLESFIIGLQAYFVQDEHTAALLKLVGNIKDESVTQFTDDGRTQAVTARTGISLTEIAPVPNPVVLRPFRTFPEIEQPESLFVFRLRQQEKQAPACGLWEADNKLWKVEAIKSIATWLREKLPGVKIIA